MAARLFRRPFAPGAIGFRAMTRTALTGAPHGGAHVAAYLNAQSIVQRLNAVVPGRWRQEFGPPPGELVPAKGGSRPTRLYLTCRLTITLPIEDGGPDVDAVYEDIGELDGGSLAGLKALYSDARKRAAVAAGIGAYLYTTLEQVVLPIGPGPRQVQAIPRPGKSDLLVLHPATEQWLRDGYRTRMKTDAVRRDLGEIFSHGEPETGVGQGEAGETAEEPAANNGASGETTTAADAVASQTDHSNGEVVSVEFGGRGTAAPDAAQQQADDPRNCEAASGRNPQQTAPLTVVSVQRAVGVGHER